MAKPPNSDTSSPSSCQDTSQYNARKRTRNPSGDSLSLGDDTHKTRRVNPQRLAVRLGPELVAEMEALIVPGAKMPSFEVRKVFQEKYCVDRRHIYDYFHSRGLRVAKEDKHMNLTRGRLARALQKQAQETHSADSPKASTPPDIPPDDDGTCDLDFQAPRKLSGFSPVVPPDLCRANKDLSPNIHRQLGVPLCLLSPQPQECSGFHKEDEHGDALLVPGSPCPEFTMTEKDCVVSYCDISVDLSAVDFSDLDSVHEDGIDTPFGSLEPDPLLAVEKHRPLNEKERMALYNLINDRTGPSGGIEERRGSYSAYMEERSRLYYDCLSLKGAREREKPLTENFGAEIDLEKWLSDPVLSLHEDNQTITPGSGSLKSTSILASPVTRYCQITSFKKEINSTRAGALVPPDISVLRTDLFSNHGTDRPLTGPSRTASHLQRRPDASSIDDFRAFKAAPSTDALQYNHKNVHTPLLSDSRSVESTWRNAKPRQCWGGGLHSSRQFGKSMLQTTLSAITKDTTPYFVQTYGTSPDHLLAAFLPHSKPTRMRTASAGGGI